MSDGVLRAYAALGHGPLNLAGLDVAIDETAICVVDGEGAVVLETAVPTDPEQLAKALKPHRRGLKRVGY